MDIWKERDFELSQRHEEILKIREAILRGTEAYYNSQDNRASSFITDYKKAKERNALLLQDIDRASCIVERELGDNSSHKQFNTLTTNYWGMVRNVFVFLQTNYWGMVRNVFPVWLEDQRMYEREHGLTYSSKSVPSQRGAWAVPGGTVTPQQGTLQESIRPESRQSGGDTTRTIPPLELDFSMGEDLTVSQGSALRQTQETTPKSALASSSGKGGKNKKVQIKDEKKEREKEKKERDRQRKEAEKRRKEAEREQKRRDKEQKEAQKKSARRDQSR